MANLTVEGFERVHFHCDKPIATVLLAHGAGAGNQHEFMQTVAAQLVALNIEVVSFNFPYMQTAYELNKKRPPNSNKQLLAHFNDELARLSNSDIPLFVAGKSMGGRIATQLACELDSAARISGCIAYGYPFIPPGKPEKYDQRVEHFSQLQVPVLICQGERDTFGNRALLEQKDYPGKIELSWITSGDHSFKPLKSSGLTEKDNIEKAAQLTHDFINLLV